MASVDIEQDLWTYVEIHHIQMLRKTGKYHPIEALYLKKYEVELLKRHYERRTGSVYDKPNPNTFMGIPIVVIDEEDKEYKGEINENI